MAEWSAVEVPAESTLYDVVATVQGPVAVGSGGTVIQRRAGGWETVLDAGPTAKENPLRAAAVTDDGRHVWFAGGSGVIGQYDVLDRQVTDYSAPGGKTSTWTAVTVTGTAGEETAFFANGSGEVLRGTKTSEGGMEWGEARKPGTGSNIPDLDFRSPAAGRAVDTNGDAYETHDGGETWTPFGIDAATVSLHGVADVAEDDVTVVGGNGYIYEWDGTDWAEHKPRGETVSGVSRAGDAGLAAGASGYVYERVRDGGGMAWRAIETPAQNALLGVALDPSGDFPDVAVGSSGTVIERGSFDALPSVIAIETASPNEVRYEFTVDGVVAGTDSTEAGDGLDAGRVVGAVGNGDSVDRYRFSGTVTDFAVRSGDAAALTVYVDGDPVSIRQLARRPWWEATSPVPNTFHAVVPTREGPYAVGSGGDVVARRHDGWEQVLDGGPAADSNPLRGADVTDDGRHVWFAGGSGVIGQYDVVEEVLTNYSAPGGKTSTWEDIAVSGPAGEERVVLVNGSGEVLWGQTDGPRVDWGEAQKPGGGSSMKGLIAAGGRFYTCDTNAKVYVSADGGESWETTGIAGGSVGLYAVDADGPDDVNVAGGDGSVFRYNGAVWTKHAVAEGVMLGVDRAGELGVAVGVGGGVFDRRRSGWTERQTPTTATLYDAALDRFGGFPDVAVGAGGTLLERGSYTALPHTLELGTAGDDVTYAVSVDGPAEVDTGGTVESGDETTLSGTVSSGETHTYRFAGDVTDLVVRSGALRDLRAELDGVAVSVERLQAQSWREADSPTDVALYDVVRSAAGPCAVGGGGRVLIRRPSGWLTAVSDGPTGESATLFGAGATDDGRHVWVAGASGVVGRYDVATGELEDHTLPNRPGATWEAVDAAGTAGKETVLLVNGSGEVVIGGVGKDGVSWTEPTKPGGGSSMKGCSLVSPEVGHAVDTNSKVYRTEDGGQSWSVIGISGGSIGLYGVAAGGTAAGLDSEATTSADDLSVAGGDGSVYQYNGAVWTKNWASDAGLLAIDRLADRGVAVGAGGRIYRRGLSGWRAEDSPASTKLNAVALGKSGPDVAVGNNGTVLERD